MESYSFLPHNDKVSWEIKKNLLDKSPNNFIDLNSIFFNNSCHFFERIDKYYKKEGEEFIKIYDNLRKLALNLENILPTQIQLLKSKTRGKKELTRKEVALIFFLSFFNLIDVTQEKFHDTNNFHVCQLLFLGYDNTFEFARSFLNYLTIIGKWLSNNNPILEEKISYIRNSKPFNENIFKAKKNLCEIELIQKGSLFDRNDSYGVDFANMYIGGGVLEGGNVQEEILFAVHPEAIVSMFFMEVMDNNDAIRMNNVIKYSNYSGYGSAFKYEGSSFNVSEENTIRRIKFIAIDASIEYMGKYGIIDQENIKRDIHKAYVGFNLINFEKEILQGKDKIEEKDKIKEKDKIEEKGKIIATGNWGCGAFRGDFELKFLQQWIAASFAEVKKLYYYTFESKKMENVIKSLDSIKKKYIYANELYNDLFNKNLSNDEVLEILLNIDKQEENDDYMRILGIKKNK